MSSPRAAFVEVVTDVIVAVVLLAGFLAIGLRAMPDDLWEPSIAVLTIAAFGCGVGFVNAVVTVFWRSWEKTYAQLTRLLYFVSGIFYVPGMMPDWVRDILAWNPLLHAIDWFRAGFFEVYQPHWLDRSYVAVVAIASLLAGSGAAPPAEPQVERRAVIALAMIELDGVAKSYRSAAGRKVLLDHVSAEFCSGYNFGILGANGAGKSTLIRLLAGSETPDRGTIRRRCRVSFPLGFGGTVHGALSGRENVAFIARVYGAGVKQTARFVEEFAELGEYFDMPVDTYSAGMRARLAFGVCLAIDFDVYLIDEVTEIGDERFRRKCAAAFRERMRSSDIILATHNHHTIRQYCDRAAVLAGGRLAIVRQRCGRVRLLPQDADEAGLMLAARNLRRRRQPGSAGPAGRQPGDGRDGGAGAGRPGSGFLPALRRTGAAPRKSAPRIPPPGFAPGCRRACWPLSRSSLFRPC